MPNVAFITKNYPNGVLQFLNAAGQPADVDTRQKEVRVEFAEGSEGTAGFTLTRVEGEKGKFTVAMETQSETLHCAGAFVADPDMTDGVGELRVPFDFPILPAPASGADFGIGLGIDK